MPKLGVFSGIQKFLSRGSRLSMPKLGVFSGKELCHILAEEGFACVRQRGSHIVMQKKTGDDTITVPVPNHREIRIGTLLSIIRQSGLSRDRFVR